MSAPTLLNTDILHRLMRIFMEYKTDILPVVERGRIVGQLDRLSLMEALSEIRPEGYPLAVKPAESSEDILRRMDTAGLDGIPTVNRAFEFNAVWGRAELLQAQGKIPQVKIWQPETGSAAAAGPQDTVTHDPAATATPVAQSTNPQRTRLAELSLAAMERARALDAEPAPSETATEAPAATRTITIVREAPVAQPAIGAEAGEKAAVAQAPTRPIAERFHRDIERGRLAINTLAALDLPLLACDGNGTEIFHNRAFGEIKLRQALHLDSGDLVRRAKDAIAESALKGELDIERAVKLKQGPRGFEIFCKAIRDFEDPSARAQGYIFWLEPTRPQAAALYATDAAAGEFSGKTLPEILAAEETRAMAWAMREANGNQSDAALLLGIPRQTFNYRYRKLMRAQAQHGARHGQPGGTTGNTE